MPGPEEQLSCCTEENLLPETLQLFIMANRKAVTAKVLAAVSAWADASSKHIIILPSVETIYLYTFHLIGMRIERRLSLGIAERDFTRVQM